jgi:hypothetical protein
MHVARIGTTKGAYNIAPGKLRGKRTLRDLGVNGGIILKWMTGILYENAN